MGISWSHRNMEPLFLLLLLYLWWLYISNTHPQFYCYRILPTFGVYTNKLHKYLNINSVVNLDLGNNLIGIKSWTISISLGRGYMTNSWGRSDRLSNVICCLDPYPSKTFPKSTFPGIIYKDDVVICALTKNYTGIFWSAPTNLNGISITSLWIWLEHTFSRSLSALNFTHISNLLFPWMNPSFGLNS